MDRLLPPKGLRFLILIILIIGIFFRFTNLGQKLFDGDESITSVRAAGYTVAEVINSIPKDTIIRPKEIETFRIVSRETSLLDTLKVTALGAPQHTPLYFVLTRIWMQWFGNSAVAMRSFTVFTSLLVFPAIYWLCMELFKSSTVASIAVALIAVSPIHIIHAQIARPRTLWILMILLSSAALLRTIRLNNKTTWVIYGVTLSLNLYTFLFSIFVASAHGIYVFIIDFQKNKIIKPYLFTASLVILSFAPWLNVIITHVNTAKKMTEWTNQPAAFPDLLGGWLKNLCDIFFYWHFKYEQTFLISEKPFVFYFGIAILSLIIYAFYFLWRNTPRQVWLFIFTLTGVTSLAVVLPDLIFGGRRSALDRYMFPCTLGIQVTVAYLLATKISLASSTLRVKSWQLITVLLISLGILSCTISGQTESWNGQEDFIIQSSRIINKATHPLIISDDDIVSGLMPLNYRLDPHVRLMLVTQPNQVALPEGFSDIFLFSPSQELLSFMQKKTEWQIKPIYQSSYLNIFLWKASSPMTLWKL